MRRGGRAEVSARVWASAWARLPVLRRYASRREQIEGLAAELLRSKHWVALADARFGAGRQARTALLMALPVAGLAVSWYRGFRSVLLYPGVFRTRQRHTDDAGVVHEWEEWRSGEAWGRGPLILALPEVASSGQGRGYNVVVHECAHQLDLLDGADDGMPPLHRDMSRRAWMNAFQAAYDDLTARVARGDRTALDAYAAEAPAEFFAVASEAFFETPRALRRAYPAVHEQLAAFYRQDPLKG